ncbi:MAG: hypothetical protein ACP5LX_02960 [Nitrososphaeria archaeon]
MHNPEKNARIREKRKDTLLRKKHQKAKTYELKLDKTGSKSIPYVKASAAMSREALTLRSG